jgi:hypothetical protein
MHKTLLTTLAATVLSVAMLGNSARALTFAASPPLGAATYTSLVQKTSLCCDWFGYFECWHFPDHYQHYHPHAFGRRCW